MTLDEAIQHARDKALEMYGNPDMRKRGQDYLQLAKWLEELKVYKKKYSGVKTGYGEDII